MKEYLNQHYCIEPNCNNKISYSTWKYGQGRCLSCANKNNKYGLKDGRCLKTYFCINCGKKISINSAINGTHRCASCATKNAFKIGKRKYHKCYCIDCEKQLKDCRSKRCEKCNYKIRSGKNHPMFGTIGHIKRIKYKNVFMRSSWETLFAQFLDLSNIKYLYESKTFDLGNSTYTPDFYLPEFNCYIEIKGWWRDKAKEKFNLFKELYPKVRIGLLKQKELKNIGII